MSRTCEIAEYVRNRLLGKTSVPDEKIYIMRPNTVFVGEGPVIIIYPMNGEREVRVGHAYFPTETYLMEGISFDVLVDDVTNDVKNINALKEACLIKEDMEKAVFGEAAMVPIELGQSNINIQGWAPGRTVNYTLENRNGSMIAMGTEIMARYTEDWTREERREIAVAYSATIQTEESTREINFGG